MQKMMKYVKYSVNVLKCDEEVDKRKQEIRQNAMVKRKREEDISEGKISKVFKPNEIE